VIGYSGGCDSTLLAAVAKEVLGNRAVCVLGILGNLSAIGRRGGFGNGRKAGADHDPDRNQ